MSNQLNNPNEEENGKETIELDKETNDFIDASFEEWLRKNGITPENNIDEIEEV